MCVIPLEPPLINTPFSSTLPPPPCTTSVPSLFASKPCGSMILLSPLSSINLGQNTLEISRQPWMSSLLVSNPGTKILLVTFFIGKKEFLLASQASKNFSTTVTAFSSKNLKLAYKPNINTSFSLRKSFRPLNPVLNGPC